MALAISNVVDFVAAAGLGLVTGTSLFEGYMGDTQPWPDACVAIYEYPGGVSETFSSGVQLVNIGIRVRGAVEGYATARALAESIRTALIGVLPGTISKIETIRPIGTVSPLGRDQNERPIFVHNFTVMVNP